MYGIAFNFKEQPMVSFRVCRDTINIVMLRLKGVPVHYSFQK